MSQVFISGGNHWDERWVTQQNLIAGESIPVQTHRQPGGAAANLYRALISQGHECTFASIYGHEPPPITGPYVTQVGDETSAKYTSIEDRYGNVLYGFADMGLYERALTPAWYRSLIPMADRADAVVVDCNGPDGALIHAGHFDLMVGLAVSPAKVRRLLPILTRLHLLFCNTAEAKALGTHLDKVAQAVVTQGKAGAHLLNWGKRVATYAAPNWHPPSSNGLGDRLAGLTVSGILQGASLTQALPTALKILPC